MYVTKERMLPDPRSSGTDALRGGLPNEAPSDTPDTVTAQSLFNRASCSSTKELYTRIGSPMLKLCSQVEQRLEYLHVGRLPCTLL